MRAQVIDCVSAQASVRLLRDSCSPLATELPQWQKEVIEVGAPGVRVYASGDHGCGGYVCMGE